MPLPWPSATAMVKAAEAARSRSSLLSCLAWPDSNVSVGAVGIDMCWKLVVLKCFINLICYMMLHGNNYTHPTWTWFQAEKHVPKTIFFKNGFSVQGFSGLQPNILTPPRVGDWQSRAFRCSIGIGPFSGSKLVGHPEPARRLWGCCTVAL